MNAQIIEGSGAPAALLLSAAGRAVLDELAGQDVDPDRTLALAESLRRRYPADLVGAALSIQALRVAARAKFSTADQMLLTRAGLEQASSELTARHAATSFADARLVADLCCGIGGNLIALASALTTEGTQATKATQATGPESTNGPLGALQAPQRAVGGPRGPGRRVIAVDADLTSLEFARHNASVCAPGAEIGYVCADVTRLSLAGIDAVFIDPARRDDRRRLPAGACQPPLGWCLRLAESVPAVGIKAAPGLRRDRVPPGWETEFVAVGRELKEALLWSPTLATRTGQAGATVAAGPGSVSRATVLPSGDTMVARTDAATPPAQLAPPGEFLLDPSPAVTRAGLVTELAHQVGGWQIDPMIAFLACDLPVRTPFARTLRVLHSAPWHEKEFARRLRELGIGSLDIRRRGLAGDVVQIHRRLGLRGGQRNKQPSGQHGAATLVLTRVNDRPWGLICERPDAVPP